jgi:hypothetical protein
MRKYIKENPDMSMLLLFYERQSWGDLQRQASFDGDDLG